MPVKYKLGDIIISNSPSKRKVLKVFSNSYVLSKPNQLDVPDTKMLYTDDYIEWKGWKKEGLTEDSMKNLWILLVTDKEEALKNFWKVEDTM